MPREAARAHLPQAHAQGVDVHLARVRVVVRVRVRATVKVRVRVRVRFRVRFRVSVKDACKNKIVDVKCHYCSCATISICVCLEATGVGPTSVTLQA